MMRYLKPLLCRTAIPFVLSIPLLFGGVLSGAELKTGFGRRQITPPLPILLAGFENRKKPAGNVANDIWTKALAFEDPGGQKVILITIDVATMPKAMSDMVAERVTYRQGIDRSRLAINVSHTHSGPALEWPAHTEREMMLRIEAYRNRVMDAMVEAASDAVQDLQPARISYGTGKVEFSHNRRQRLPSGGWVFGIDPNGPVDQTVPVVRVFSPAGKLRGVLFGLSCHPSVLTYEFYVVSGDYAGIAQAAWEKAHPGATAMFMQLCGGDQNTYPRRKMELAEKYGHELATEVDRVMASPMKPVRPPLKAAMLTTELPFAPFSLAGFEQRTKDPDELVRSHAVRMVKQYESGNPPLPALPYTMQAIQFGKDLTVLAMNGEVVVDYALRVKKEYGADGMIVAGYTNDRPCYIPSLRVLKEGGYEARDNMLMDPWPGPFSGQVEEIIFTGIRKLMQTVGRAPVH
ncbi:MAG: neutral/alkaline non-lysosomal ceramidase N-terminal domain-containing protein [Bryobacteraceae bacterium]